MKVDSLIIKNLHGYLDFNLTFYPDLNFLIGINGSGKTSVLNVIAWMLRASLMNLAQLDFSHIKLGCTGNDGTQKIISAQKNKGHIVISIEGISQKLTIPILEYPSETLLAERTASSISEMYDRFQMEKKEHPVLLALDAIGSPVYLPLDRRWETTEREMVTRVKPTTYRLRSSSMRRGVVESVLYLAERYYREQLSKLAQLNEKLRVDLVEYTFGDIISLSHMGNAPEPWTKGEIDNKRKTILKGLLQADIKLSKGVVEKYFTSLGNIANALRNEKTEEKDFSTPATEWILNLPQLDKIERVIKRIEQYNSDRSKLLKKPDEFTDTVNSFLRDTGKLIKFDSSNEIIVEIDKSHSIRPGSLSSGERQLVILFAYLYFGFESKKFVVMIDEPELSIHLEWQHRYIEAVKNANPDAQFILATHAPEIAHGFDDKCIDLSRKS